MANYDTDPTSFTGGLREELSDLQSSVGRVSSQLAKELAQAVIDGKELDGLLQKLVLQQSDRAASSAMNSVFDLAGSLGEGLVGSVVGGLTGGASNIFNVNVASPNPASFRSSETQLASSLARAVSRGQRGL